MSQFVLKHCATFLLLSVVGCAGVAPDTVTVATQESSARGEYCHKKLPAVGPTDANMVGPSPGDIIDYYGPCDGPTMAEQLQQQRHFESFRFGRDYMDEG
jgi:hypothetical protein